MSDQSIEHGAELPTPTDLDPEVAEIRNEMEELLRLSQKRTSDLHKHVVACCSRGIDNEQVLMQVETHLRNLEIECRWEGSLHVAIRSIDHQEYAAAIVVWSGVELWHRMAVESALTVEGSMTQTALHEGSKKRVKALQRIQQNSKSR